MVLGIRWLVSESTLIKHLLKSRRMMPLVFAVILMILALHKATLFWRLTAGFRGFRLLTVVIQDQFLYFMLWVTRIYSRSKLSTSDSAVTCSVINIIGLSVDDEGIALVYFVNTIGNPSCLCILGSYLLVNLKEAGELGVNEGTNYRLDFIPPSASDIELAGVQGEDPLWNTLSNKAWSFYTVSDITI